MTRPPLDPYAILGALERGRIGYVLVGALARVLHGSDEITDGVDLTPSLRADNIDRLQAVVDELDARRPDGSRVTLAEVDREAEQVVRIRTSHGEIGLVWEPAGTRGYDDLRRPATREALGHGLRVSVASPADLARMLDALPEQNRSRDLVLAMRRIAELDQQRGISR